MPSGEFTYIHIFVAKDSSHSSSLLRTKAFRRVTTWTCPHPQLTLPHPADTIWFKLLLFHGSSRLIGLNTYRRVNLPVKISITHRAARPHSWLINLFSGSRAETVEERIQKPIHILHIFSNFSDYTTRLPFVTVLVRSFVYDFVSWCYGTAPQWRRMHMTSWRRASLGRGPDAIIQVQKAGRLTALSRNCHEGRLRASWWDCKSTGLKG